MSRRTTSWLAWSTCALSISIALLGVLFLVVLSRLPHSIFIDQWLENVMVIPLFSPLLAMVTVLSFSTMGAVITSRRPDTPIGWLFCAIGFVGGVRLLSTECAAYSVVGHSGMSAQSLVYPLGSVPAHRGHPVGVVVKSELYVGVSTRC